MLTYSLTYRGLVGVGCRVSRSICGDHGGSISHWLIGVGPAAPRAPSIDAVASNTGLLCCDVTSHGGTTNTTFTLTTVSRVSWSRPIGPLKHKNTILWDGSAEHEHYILHGYGTVQIRNNFLAQSAASIVRTEAYFCSDDGSSRSHLKWWCLCSKLRGIAHHNTRTVILNRPPVMNVHTHCNKSFLVQWSLRFFPSAVKNLKIRIYKTIILPVVVHIWVRNLGSGIKGGT
jgi:hypothetical protein